ncbi:hypothetical protein ACFLSQ_06150 [Bacteroidota bacterium]
MSIKLLNKTLISFGLIFSIILLLLSGCATTKKSKAEDYGYRISDERIEIRNLIQDKKLKEARNRIAEILEENKDVQPAPFVKDSILHYFADNSVATLAYMLQSVSMMLPPKDSSSNYNENKQNLNWKQSVVIDPIVPHCYFDLAYIDIEENMILDAIENLKKAIYYWPDYMEAYAELAYIHIGMLDFKKAHEVIDSALAKPNGYLFPIGLSMVYRRLGYMEIEEGKLDDAEAHFEKSLKLFDHPAARHELEYIEKIRKKLN